MRKLDDRIELARNSTATFLKEIIELNLRVVEFDAVTLKINTNAEAPAFRAMNTHPKSFLPNKGKGWMIP